MGINRPDVPSLNIQDINTNEPNYEGNFQDNISNDIGFDNNLDNDLDNNIDNNIDDGIDNNDMFNENFHQAAVPTFSDNTMDGGEINDEVGEMDRNMEYSHDNFEDFGM